MKIQYCLEHDDEGNLISQFINIDISEDATIGDLLPKLHEAINIPMHRELKWDGNTIKVSCSHHIQNKPEPRGFSSGIENLDQKISEFPKHGLNGELSIYINKNEGLAN